MMLGKQILRDNIAASTTIKNHNCVWICICMRAQAHVLRAE